jgi:hypothetical protein
LSRRTSSGRIELEIGVLNDDGVSGGQLQAEAHRRAFAEIDRVRAHATRGSDTQRLASMMACVPSPIRRWR